MKNLFNRVCAIFMATVFAASMFSCAFEPPEIQSPAQPSLEHLVTGVPSAVQIRSINLMPSGARSVAGAVVNEAEMTFGTMTINSVDATSVNLSMQLTVLEGYSATLTRTMYLSDRVAFVNGETVPVLTGTKTDSNFENAILVESFNRGIPRDITNPCAPEIPGRPNDPDLDMEDYEIERGGGVFEGNLRYECKMQQLYDTLLASGSHNLILSDMNRGEWRIDFDNGDFVNVDFTNLKHNCKRDTILVTLSDGSTEEIDLGDDGLPGGIGGVWGNKAVPLLFPLDPLTGFTFIMLLILLGIIATCAACAG